MAGCALDVSCCRALPAQSQVQTGTVSLRCTDPCAATTAQASSACLQRHATRRVADPGQESNTASALRVKSVHCTQPTMLATVPARHYCHPATISATLCTHSLRCATAWCTTVQVLICNTSNPGVTVHAAVHYYSPTHKHNHNAPHGTQHRCLRCPVLAACNSLPGFLYD